ncbi:MAG: (2Fe-2S)-binding protein, partial [Agathobacter sp.]|nr:(2Fe-2S)-binding protein [Agathobacter sp.]
MVNIIINGQPVSVPEGTTIADAAAATGTKIPRLCFLKDINEIGACRVCVVEIEGKDSLVASCNTVVSEGMSIQTHSKKALDARKTNVELILSQHDYRCATCIRSGNCELQAIAQDMNIHEIRFPQKYEEQNWNEDFPLVRNASKCIKCMRCVQVCDKVQGLGVWDIVNTGRRTSVNVSNGATIEAADCALCGQCITHCPVGALHERDDVHKLIEAIADEDKIVVLQIAPAVRAAWGEPFGLTREQATVKRLVAALRKANVDYIFDTDFTADLTIMEEGYELLDRLAHKEDHAWPMFTSCCPGWVRFIKSQYPDMVPQLSTAKSPQQMFGAVAKTYYAQLLDVEPERIFSVSIMPCTAKKAEADMPEMRSTEAGPDIDVVITTRELGNFLRSMHIDLASLEEEEFDMPLGIGSGAGVIFGATGGVMEAALRSAYYFVTGENPDADAFSVVRGANGIREAEVEIAGAKVRAAIVSGLGEARKLIEAIRRGEAEYDFVEVMACPGGCAGGGGQPICHGKELAA